MANENIQIINNKIIYITPETGEYTVEFSDGKSIVARIFKGERLNMKGIKSITKE